MSQGNTILRTEGELTEGKVVGGRVLCPSGDELLLLESDLPS